MSPGLPFSRPRARLNGESGKHYEGAEEQAKASGGLRPSAESSLAVSGQLHKPVGFNRGWAREIGAFRSPARELISFGVSAG